MTDTTITPEERAQWRDRLTSPLSCHDAEHASFTLRLLDALEAAEKERDELETYIAKLVYVLTDGKLSKPYDIAVIAEEVENIYQEYFRNELEPKLQKAEAENAQLQKMVEWLAAELSDGCSTSRCVYEGATESCPLECGEHSAGHWKEAARRAVAAGDGE